MMEMDKFNADWWNLKEFKEQFELGRINLTPDYQRGKVWKPEKRYPLIDSVTQGFPIGLVMLNVIERVEDGVQVKHYDVVDGQQRIRTLLEYMLATESWAKVENRKDFMPFTKLKLVLQQKFYGYKVPVALMTKFEENEINEIYNRLQQGMPLKPGEKLKSLTTSKFHSHIKELTQHRIFTLGEGRLQVRDSHWMLGTAFFKATYTGDLFGRLEYANLHRFMKDEKHDSNKSCKTVDSLKKLLNFQRSVLVDALDIEPSFVLSERSLKWLFIGLSKLRTEYGLSGKERAVAEGAVSYYRAVAVERSAEWTDYLNAGRTGRVDTEQVKACIAELCNHIVNSSMPEPIDPQRNFTKQQRQEILQRAGGKCENCQTPLSATNFHADHRKAHSVSGKTEIENGRALCSGCNRKFGNKWREAFQIPLSTEIGN